ncbi:MAG: acetate--CoA ligase family protein [Anaerolineales bacterium]
MDRSINTFFKPKGVVIVGVSQNPNKLGYGLARNIISCGYTGEVFFVNIKGGELFDRKIYKSIRNIPKRVDLALLMIPAKNIPSAILECGEVGIKTAIILSGGFSEVGEEGVALEKECMKNASIAGVRIIGPNCIGLIDTHLPIDTTFLPPPSPVPGEITFISHSGAICAATIDWARGQGFSFSRLVSLGNQIDVNETDILTNIAEDKNTQVITLYLEGLEDGRRFIDTASKISQQKPIIAIKAGRYEGGQRAVTSHTGALAGQDVAYDAAFRRAGVIRARTVEEMFDWAKALAWCPLPKGNRVAVLTNAGGPGVTGVDALELNKLKLAKFSQNTDRRLMNILPPAASISNPVDMLASASPEQYAQSLEILLKDDGIDSVLLILPSPPMYTAESVADAVIPVIKHSSKPILVALMGEKLIIKAAERFRDAKIPEYRFPERAASAIAVLTQRSEGIEEYGKESVIKRKVQKEKVIKILQKQNESKVGFLQGLDVYSILSAYYLPTCSLYIVKTPEEASRVAQKIGFPVVMKVASAAAIHKSDHGGVLLNLTSVDQVMNGFQNIMDSFDNGENDGEQSGVYLQKMIQGGQEVIVGAAQDPQFGAMVMFGAGGVEVEGMQDVAFSLAPVMKREIDYLLENTWAGRRLKGFRNVPEADIDAVKDVIIRLGQLAGDFPIMKEIDINPLIVMPKGEGVKIVDARIKLL